MDRAGVSSGWLFGRAPDIDPAPTLLAFEEPLPTLFQASWSIGLVSLFSPWASRAKPSAPRASSGLLVSGLPESGDLIYDVSTQIMQKVEAMYLSSSPCKGRSLICSSWANVLRILANHLSVVVA